MLETKARILAAAEELIAESGIESTTISTIARKANVADSLLYQHFKGKQDLLFSVAYLKIQQSIELMKEQLQGIRDAESKLSRMVWSGLHYLDQNPGYTRILLFECRSNREFYTSQGHELLRKHSHIMVDILKEGAQNNLFRPDLDMNLVRDIIYGTMDAEAISCMAGGEIEKNVHDFDAVMALILPMITVGKGVAEPNKRELILDAAENVFSENAFAKATIAQVAQVAGVAEGTIYDHFKSKDDLLFSVAARGFDEHLKGLPQVFEVKTPARKLRRLLRYHFMIYSTNRRFLKVFLTQILFNLAFYKSSAYEGFKLYISEIEDIIEEGKRVGAFREDVNARVFRNMFLGAFSFMAIRWLLVGDNRPYDKMTEIDHLVDLLTRAVS